jgi:hypothetical protein
MQSTPQQQKVFKVFHDAAGVQHVGVDALRDTLRARRAAPPSAGVAAASAGIAAASA